MSHYLTRFVLILGLYSLISEYKYSSPNKNKGQDSLTSGNSMLSIHSDKGTSLYETVSFSVFVCLFVFNCMYQIRDIFMLHKRHRIAKYKDSEPSYFHVLDTVAK